VLICCSAGTWAGADARATAIAAPRAGHQVLPVPGGESQAASPWWSSGCWLTLLTWRSGVQAGEQRSGGAHAEEQSGGAQVEESRGAAAHRWSRGAAARPRESEDCQRWWLPECLLGHRWVL
jgi:hypothetical protein